MLGRIFKQRPHPTLAHHTSALAYSQFELAILSLCAQAIAYYARTGYWPRLAPHDSQHIEVWPNGI